MLLDEVVASLNLTKVSSHSHFIGPGVSSVIILSESHLSVHTWPELGYLHIDLVICTKQLTCSIMESEFRSVFQPEFLKIVQLEY